MTAHDQSSKKLKITLFSYVFWPENFVINDLVESLCQNGHEIEISTSLPNYATGQMHQRYSILSGPYVENWKNSVIKRFPVVSRQKGFVRLALNYMSNIFSGLINLFRLNKTDLIFVYATSPLIAFIPAVIFKIIHRVPLVIWYQDLWPDSFFAVIKTQKLNFIKPILDILVRFIYRYTDVMLIQNQLFNENLDRLGFKGHRQTIYNWSLVDADHSEMTHTNRHKKTEPAWIAELPQNKMIFAFAGNIGKVQGIAEIIEVARQIEITQPRLHFVFVGDGSFLTEAQSRSKGLGNVTWIARQPLEDMPYLFAKSHVMIVSLGQSPTMSMVIPGKLQAYFAAAKPVLGFIDGATSEIIKASQAGLVARAGQLDQLKQVIEQFAQFSEIELQNLGQNARNFYEAHFTKRKIIAEIESELHSVVKKYRR